MTMKQIFLWILLSLKTCFGSLEAQVYYISPNVVDVNCTVNGNITLSSCYSFQQLIDNEALLSVENSTLILFLLPGTHMIPENHTLRASNLGELDIQPWNSGTEEKIVIQCQSQADVIFKDIDKLSIFSLHFDSCSLQYIQSERQWVWRSNQTLDGNKFKRLFNIVQCMFEHSSSSYAINVGITKFELDIIVANSTFVSNNGAIKALNFNSINEVPIDMNLLIRNTGFWSNWRSGNDDVGNGGALNIVCVNLQLNKINFTNNSANGAGGAISSRFSDLMLQDVIFHHNYVFGKGGSIHLYFFTYVQIYNCQFENNSAGLSGGAIYAKGDSGTQLRIQNTIFQDNYVAGEGSGIFILNVGGQIYDSLFRNNSANNGGGIYMEGNLEVMYIINSTFSFNQAKTDGGAIFCKGYRTRFTNHDFELEVYSTYNFAINGNGGFTSMLQCEVAFSSGYIISNNKAVKGGAIYAEESAIAFFNTSVIGNMAEESGGGLYLINTKINFNTVPALVKISHNVVTSDAGKGGGIYVLDNNCETVSDLNFQCFVSASSFQYQHLFFSNNTASQGSVLYGGLLDRCLLDYDRQNGIENITQISRYEPSPEAISSDPVRVCFCNDDYKSECSKRELRLSKRRGEVFSFIGSVVDQNNHPKTSIIRAGYSKSSADLDKGEGRTRIGSNCSKLSYHIFTRDTEAMLTLQAEGFCERSRFSSLTVHVQVTSCSRGFEQSNDRCVCDRRLANYLNTTDCDIETDSIKRTGPIWLQYDRQYLKVYKTCPLDYCQVSSDTISFLFPDEQCANHRSRVLCGACQENYSIALGGSKCLHCTSRYTFIWLTVVFAVAGVALVTLLLVCNMTISTGTLNGLIFYANVISISGLTNLPNCSIHPIFAVFIAWLNLDLGVETCFYSGMNTYQKTWLQFAFPLYIWLLVGAIIVASYYSSKAMRVFGRNNIAILATLFFLSYSKILKTIIASFSFTQVLQSSAENVTAQLVPSRVWTYDSNIEYLKGKHVALFVVALVFLIFVFLPYTLLLMFGQCVRSISAKRSCRLFVKLIRSAAFISILDAYHAPYNQKHRYWTGLMLLTRCVLFLSFASSYRDSDVLTNMYITTLVLVGILTLRTHITKVYKNAHIQTLEVCFFLNLLILSATVYHKQGDTRSICKCTSASISLSVIGFIGILTYHTLLKIRKTQYYTSCKHVLLTKWPSIGRKEEFPSRDRVNACQNSHQTLKNFPTTSHVDLREELLASEEKSIDH